MTDEVERKPVVVKLEVEMVIDVPADWDGDMVNFHLNESSHCLGTEIAQLYHEDNAREGRCFSCHRIEGRYCRDAMDADIDRLRLETS